MTKIEIFSRFFFVCPNVTRVKSHKEFVLKATRSSNILALLTSSHSLCSWSVLAQEKFAEAKRTRP